MPAEILLQGVRAGPIHQGRQHDSQFRSHGVVRQPATPGAVRVVATVFHEGLPCPPALIWSNIQAWMRSNPSHSDVLEGCGSGHPPGTNVRQQGDHRARSVYASVLGSTGRAGEPCAMLFDSDWDVLKGRLTTKCGARSARFVYNGAELAGEVKISSIMTDMSHSPWTNARRHPRTSVSFPVDVVSYSAGSTTQDEGRLAVVGAGGAFLELSGTYDISSLLRLAFELPSTPGDMTCTATIQCRLVQGGWRRVLTPRGTGPYR